MKYLSPRWVCTSGLSADLAVTDNISLQVQEGIVAKGGNSLNLPQAWERGVTIPSSLGKGCDHSLQLGKGV